MRCKTLTAIYKNEINTLKKLYEIDFLIHKSVRIHIEQFTVRKIEIDFTSEQLVDDLIAVLTKVERLLMMLNGLTQITTVLIKSWFGSQTQEQIYVNT